MASAKMIEMAIGFAVVLFSNPAAGQSFDFNGEELPPGWTVTRADPENFIVENGALLLVANVPGSFAEGTVVNLFENPETISDRDWLVEVIFEAEFQTAKEVLSLGVTDQNASFVLASLYSAGDKYNGWSLNVGVHKNTGSRTADFSEPLASLGCNVCAPDRQFANFAETIKQPMTLQLEKTGRQYVARAKLGDLESQWIETFRVTMLRDMPSLVFFATQSEATDGETIYLIDSINVSTK